MGDKNGKKVVLNPFVRSFVRNCSPRLREPGAPTSRFSSPSGRLGWDPLSSALHLAFPLSRIKKQVTCQRQAMAGSPVCTWRTVLRQGKARGWLSSLKLNVYWRFVLLQR